MYALIFYRAFNEPTDWLAILPGALAGFVTSGTARAKLYADDQVFVDIERRYREFVHFLDVRIASKSVAEQSQWRLRAAEVFKNTSTEELANAARTFSDNAYEQGELTAEARKEFNEVIGRASEDPSQRAKGTVLQIILDAGGRDFIKSSVRRVKQESRKRQRRR